MISSCNKLPVNQTNQKSSENLNPAAKPEPERKRTYDVQHIKINVGFDWNEKKVLGEVETRIIPLSDNFREFDVDAVGFNIASIRDKNNAEMKYDYNEKQIKIDPGKKYSVSDTIIYTVNYTCQPQKGLYFIYPTELNPSLLHQIWTQGGQEENRYWIPVYDYPNDKTTFEIYIRIDDKYKTLSNGYLDYSKKISGSNGSNEREDHWVMDKPNSTYLIMLTAGEFNITEDEYGSIPVQYYTDRNVTLSDAEFTFRNTPEMIKVFEEKFAYKYPWNKYAQVVVEDFLFGGMENTTATILNNRVIISKEIEKDFSTDALIAHELSHQWFGDLITCSNWSELWLNESFGTYSAALWKENYSGRDEYDYDIFNNGETAIASEKTAGRLPVWAGYGSLHANQYEKGSVVLNTFRFVLGDTVFFSSLSNFLKEYEYKNIVTEDFLNVINKTYNSANNSGENFKWMFDQWIWKAGYPEFKVKYEYDENSKKVALNVRQVQSIDSLTPVFRVPLDIRLKNSTEDKIVRVEIPDADETFYLSSDSKPVFVEFDYGNKILKKTYFDKAFEEWRSQYELSENAIDRISALRGAEIFLKEDTSHTAGKPVINYGQSEALNLFRLSLQNDKFWGVRAEAAKILAVNFILDRTGTVLKDSYDSQTDPRVKKEILKALGNSKRSEDIDFIKTKIQNEPDNFLVAEGISSLGKTLPAGEIYEAVIPFSARISYGNIVQRAVIESLGNASDKTEDQRIKKAIMDFAFGKDIEGRLRASAIFALKKYAGDEDVKNLSVKYADNKFIFVKSAFIILLSYSKDKSVIPFLKSLNDKTTDTLMNNLILSSIKRLEKSN